jgi:LPXTG-motif cell wall-anchored protein
LDSDTTDNTSSASITVTATANQAPVPTPDPGTPASGGTTLPRTGNSSLGGPLTLAALMVAAGIASLVIARRRREATA